MLFVLCVKNIFLYLAYETQFFEVSWTSETSFPEAVMPWNIF